MTATLTFYQKKTLLLNGYDPTEWILKKQIYTKYVFEHIKTNEILTLEMKFFQKGCVSIAFNQRVAGLHGVIVNILVEELNL